MIELLLATIRSVLLHIRLAAVSNIEVQGVVQQQVVFKSQIVTRRENLNVIRALESFLVKKFSPSSSSIVSQPDPALCLECKDKYLTGVERSHLFTREKLQVYQVSITGCD